MADLIAVDDDPPIRSLLAEVLKRAGHQVRTAADATALRALFGERAADLVVLDLTLPDEDGLTAARWLRASGSEPGILILSALGEPIDRVAGLEAGADDYLVKPFAPEELVGRIEAILRRRRQQTVPLRLGPWRIEAAGGRLVNLSGDSLKLSGSELALVQVFAGHPNRVLSRDELLELAPAREDTFDRSIDHRIRRLRQKIDPDPAHPTLIRSVRGKGYLYRS